MANDLHRYAAVLDGATSTAAAHADDGATVGQAIALSRIAHAARCQRRLDGNSRLHHEEASMKDVSIVLDHQPGALARLGQALGRAGVSVEGGGAWVVSGLGHAHFLVHDAAAPAAEAALATAGLRVVAVRDVLVQRLRQDVPGQLGVLCGRMAEAGVNIEVLYSDHDNRLILVVDDMVIGREVSAAWMREWHTTA